MKEDEDNQGEEEIDTSISETTQSESENWLIIDVTSSSTCNIDNAEISFLFELGNCHKWVDEAPFQTYRVTECEKKSYGVILTGHRYLEANCKGVNEDFELLLPLGCVNSTTYTCSSNPTAISEEWPAFGAYQENSCKTPVFIAAFNPHCSDYSLYGSYSTSTTCDTSFTFDAYNTSTTCSGDPLYHFTMPVETCQSISASPSTIAATTTTTTITSNLFSLPSTPAFLSSTAETVEWFAYSSCSGANSIPGIKSNDGSSSDDDAYGGLTAGGFFTVVIVGALICVAIGLVGYRLKSKKQTNTDSLKEKLSKREDSLIQL